ncbi:hypothetical protein JR316_0002270 [Psilocybe cubensis]|uniref:Uncharacterized protein n=1 Tax=Psilocybe cubensis TaxID=181762 RepID=A0ACB8HCI6_PSICU|nr:hypothetical protein JR316_0002270 [Psilocybe cubensis]KAH9485362.1 hypothetical protein JR316_0002270 [Psilocybe cubensis]
MQPPLDIPTRSRRPSSYISQHFGEPHLLVGSPEPLGSNPFDHLHVPNEGSDLGLPATPISSSHGFVSSLPRKRSTTAQPSSSYTSFTRPISNERERHPEQQWSLFGQLMENEGYLSPKAPSTIRGRRDSGSDYFGLETTSAVSGLSPRLRGIRQHTNSVKTVSPIRSSIYNEAGAEEYDSEDHSSVVSTFHSPDNSQKPWHGYFSLGRLSPSLISQNVLKCAIAYFVGSLIIKEGGLETLLQVSGIILCGSSIANFVCFLIWPQSAIINLQLSMVKTLESFSTLLPMLTSIFLLENDSDEHAQDLHKIQKAVENHQSSFTSLRKNLREAKSEWILTGTLANGDGVVEEDGSYRNISGQRSYEDAVDSLNRLAQHLNGLRSGTRLQYDLSKAGIKARTDRAGKSKAAEPNADEDEAAILRAAADMFGDLVDELGPPLKALSSTSTNTLNRLKDVCLESRQDKKGHIDIIQPHEFSDLVDGIEAALIRFESTSNHAVLRLYRRSDNPLLPNSPSSPIFGQDTSHTSSGDVNNENVFLVYFFIFTLQEFAKELIALVDPIERIYCYEQQMLRRGPWWYRLMTWVQGIFSSTLNFRKSLAYMIPRYRATHPAFPKIKPHAPDTIQTPPRHQLSIIGKVNQSLWSFGKRLKERDTKYAIKVGMATLILAFPAFVEDTRPTFVEYWGDWALISFFVVISPTIGATNYLSLQRFLGTLFGASVAVTLYTLLPEDGVALSITGFLFSLPCFYFAVSKPQYLSASRFVLLTYNLTCLYCYNLRQKDVSVIDIGVHRALAVTVGILWAAFVSRFWWPSEARRELSKSLSEFCLHIGWLYTRLVASNSFAPEYRQEGSSLDPTSRAMSRHSNKLQPTRLTNSIHEFMAMELHLQIKLIELQTLLAQAQHEPRLKGPFPVDLYRQILTSLQSILDKLHSMRYTSVRQDFIVPVNKERREMVGNIMLSFSTLAASFRLKAPLPPYLPPVEKSRLRLTPQVEAIRKLDVVKNRDAKVSRQLLFFAYALTMKGVTMELEFLGRTLQDAFGVIGQTSEEFEQLFLPLGESSGNIEHVA